MERACSHWARAISSGISHRSNMHEWEITTVWGAITSPKSVRVRWHYLAGWEPLPRRGSAAPKRARAALLLWGEPTIWSPPATWGHLSGDKRASNVPKPVRHEAQRGSFVFNHQFPLRRRFFYLFFFHVSSAEIGRRAAKSISCWKGAREDNWNQTCYGINMPLCRHWHVGQVAIGAACYVIMGLLLFFWGRFNNIWGKGGSL